MGHKASVMREKCCGMVLHGGRPDPVEVVDALTELEAERDVLASRIERMEAALQTFCCGDETMENILWDDVSPDDLVTIRVKHSAYRAARAALKGRQP